MCAADDGVAAVGPKLADGGTILLNVMRSWILAFNAYPEVASTLPFSAQGITQGRILFQERLNQFIVVDVDAAQAATDATKNDPNVGGPIQPGQMGRVAHVGSGEVSPSADWFLCAFATGQQHDIGAEEVADGSDVRFHGARSLEVSSKVAFERFPHLRPRKENASADFDVGQHAATHPI